MNNEGRQWWLHCRLWEQSTVCTRTKFSSSPPPAQVLDAALLQRLRLTPSQAAQLPLHLHLHRLLLPGTGPKDAPIQLVAPLPTYFSRTLQRLGLHHQEPSLCP